MLSHVLPGETEVVFVLFHQEESVQSLGERVDQETLDSSTLANTLIANLSSLNVLIEGNMRPCAICIFCLCCAGEYQALYLSDTFLAGADSPLKVANCPRQDFTCFDPN